MTRWDGDPKPDTSWRGKSETGGVQTRHVIDRTLGAWVIYRYRERNRYYSVTVPLEKWNAWAKTAKKV